MPSHPDRVRRHYDLTPVTVNSETRIDIPWGAVWPCPFPDATCAECGQASTVCFYISDRLWRCMACDEKRG